LTVFRLAQVECRQTRRMQPGAMWTHVAARQGKKTRGITRRHRHKGKEDGECRTVSVGDACFRNRLVVSAAKHTTNTRGRTAPVGGPPWTIQASVYTPSLSHPSVPVPAHHRVLGSSSSLVPPPSLSTCCKTSPELPILAHPPQTLASSWLVRRSALSHTNWYATPPR
jgi:hypothetical protein